MSLKLAKGPLFAGLAVLLVAGVVFSLKFLTPDLSLFGLTMSDYGDLFAIALGVFALMLGALSFVMAKPVPKAPKQKKASSESEEAPLDLLDDEDVQESVEPELDDKAAARLAAKQERKAKAQAKKDAAEKRKEEKAAAKAAKAEAKAKAKEAASDDVDLIDDAVDLIGDEYEPETETAEASSDTEDKAEATETVEADESAEPEVEEFDVTEEEMLEESGASNKKLTAAEKRAERAAKREAAKRAKEEARFQKQAEKEAAKAAKAAEKAEKKGLVEEDSYEMLSDGQIVIEESDDVATIQPELVEDDHESDATPDDATETVEEEAVMENDPSEPVEDESEDLTEESPVEDAVESTVEEDEDPVDEEAVEIDNSLEEVAEEVIEDDSHEFAAPKLAVDPKWITEAFNDDRFVVPFSSNAMQSDRDARMDALMERMGDVLERLEKVESAQSEPKAKSTK